MSRDARARTHWRLASASRRVLLLGVPQFPETRYSVVAALGSAATAERERAIESIASVYRDPIIAVLRQRWRLEPADAEDLAHDFLAHALDRDWLQRYDRSKGRFRTFLRSCLMAYASTVHEADTRLKRGGGAPHLSFDPALHSPADTGDIAALFDREWVRSVLATALDALRLECEAAGRQLTYRVFVAYDIDGAERDPRPGYAEVARQFDVPATQVTNYLNWARRRLRSHVLDTLRALTTDEAEYREELRTLLGIDPP